MNEDNLPSIKGLEYIKKLGKLQVQRNIVDIDSALRNWFAQIGYGAQHIEFHINPFSAITINVRIRLVTEKMRTAIKQQIEKCVPMDLDSIIPSDNFTIIQLFTYEHLSSRPLKNDALKAFIEKYGAETSEETENKIEEFYHTYNHLKTKLKIHLDAALEIAQELGIENVLALKGIKHGAYNTYTIGTLLRSIGYNAGVYENLEWGSEE